MNSPPRLSLLIATVSIVALMALLIVPAPAQNEPASVSATPRLCPANGKLKIFVLAGQSNMVGFGQLKGSPGTMESLLKSNPT
ncbi:MAG: hypothetical protein ACR2NM_06160, partial [Bythopirellula sp.]